MNMFRSEYVPLDEREKLAHEYLPLKKTTKLVTEIAEIFIERALFCHEYAALEKVQMSCYLSMLKTGIHEFVSTQRYSSFIELQSFSRRM